KRHLFPRKMQYAVVVDLGAPVRLDECGGIVLIDDAGASEFGPGCQLAALIDPYGLPLSVEIHGPAGSGPRHSTSRQRTSLIVGALTDDRQTNVDQLSRHMILPNSIELFILGMEGRGEAGAIPACENFFAHRNFGIETLSLETYVRTAQRHDGMHVLL